MNLKQAARRLGVHYQTAYRWVRAGRLAAVRVGNGYDVSEHAIEQLLAENEAMRRDYHASPRNPARRDLGRDDGSDASETSEGLQPGPAALICAATAAYDAMDLSPRAVYEIV